MDAAYDAYSKKRKSFFETALNKAKKPPEDDVNIAIGTIETDKANTVASTQSFHGNGRFFLTKKPSKDSTKVPVKAKGAIKWDKTGLIVRSQNRDAEKAFATTKNPFVPKSLAKNHSGINRKAPSIPESLKDYSAVTVNATNSDEGIPRLPYELWMFRFLELPPEIRYIIYDLVLTGPDNVIALEVDITVSTRWLPPPRFKPVLRSYFNLIVSCHEIHHEVAEAGLLFRINTFDFGSTRAMYYFLLRIGELARTQLCSVYINCQGTKAAVAFEKLRACIGLRKLMLRLPSVSTNADSWSGGPDSFMRSILKLRGLDEVIFDQPHRHGRLVEYWTRLPYALATCIRQQLMRPRTLVWNAEPDYVPPLMFAQATRFGAGGSHGCMRMAQQKL
ncbi:hypothetical protein BJ546DRAFT_1062769 [Cryomyces antarcticus]